MHICIKGDFSDATLNRYHVFSLVSCMTCYCRFSRSSSLAAEPVEGHGGVGRPQHAHGRRGHVSECLVPPPPILLLCAHEGLRALRPPRRLYRQLRAPPCPEPSQLPLSGPCPAPPRPETRLYLLRSPGPVPRATRRERRAFIPDARALPWPEQVFFFFFKRVRRRWAVIFQAVIFQAFMNQGLPLLLLQLYTVSL